MYIRSMYHDCAVNYHKIVGITTSVTTEKDVETSWDIFFDDRIKWHYDSKDKMEKDFDNLMKQLDCRPSKNVEK